MSEARPPPHPLRQRASTGNHRRSENIGGASRRTRAVAVSALLLLPVLLCLPGPVRGAGAESLDGGRYGDLAVGAPIEGFEGQIPVVGGGAVSVLYGASGGLGEKSSESWLQGALADGETEDGDRFGMSLAMGDFDGDGFYDLAVGAPYEQVGGVAQAGAVNVIYGSAPGGLIEAGSQSWTQETPGVLGFADEGDRFGSSLAADDFNGDGYDDLAIGVPHEHVGDREEAGAVQILYGSAEGLTTEGDAWLDLAFDEVLRGQAGALFGTALATGDFDRDGYADLAVGAPRHDVGDVVNAGAVVVFYSGGEGFDTREGNSHWFQDGTAVLNSPEMNDSFGLSLAVGDFDGDRYDDLAVGVPCDDVLSVELARVTDAGAVNVLYGSPDGITASGSDHWHQDVPGIGGSAEEADFFGYSLTAGDFDGDGCADLAVGVPYEDKGFEFSGIVQVLYGTRGGLSAVGQQMWSQDSAGVPGQAEALDRFGFALAAGDFNGDRRADLAVGSPGEAIGDLAQAGAVHVLHGSAQGLTGNGAQLWYQGYAGLGGTAEAGDLFGYALAAVPPERRPPSMAPALELLLDTD